MVDLLLAEGLPRSRHRQPRRRAAAEPRASQERAATSASTSATCGTWQPDDPLFTGASYVFHFAGIGDIVPSIERPIDYMSTNVHGHGARARSRPPRRGEEVRLCRVVVLLRAGAERARPRKTRRITPEYPYALSKLHGRAGGVPLGQRLQAAGELHPHLQRLRHALADLRRLWRGLRRVPRAEAHGQAVHAWSATARSGATSFTSRTSRAPFTAAATTNRSQRDLQPRRGQSADGQPAGRTARRRGRPSAEAPRRTGLHLGGHHARSAATSAGSRASRSRKVSQTMLANIEYWREAPVWDVGLHPGRPPRPGSHSSTKRRQKPRMTTRAEDERSRLRAQDQDAARSCARSSARGRAKKAVIMCHGTFDLVHPGHIRHLHLRQEQGGHPGHQSHVRLAHQQGATSVLLSRRICAR